MTPKAFVTVIAAVIVACSATVIGLYVIVIGPGNMLPRIIRFVLTCLLCYSLIQGWNPGRWITVILLGLAAIVGIIGGMALLARSPSGLALIALGLVYTGCIVGLLTSKADDHFVPKHYR